MFSQLTVRLGSGRPGLFVLQHVTVGPKKGPGVGRIFVSICHPCEKGLFNEQCSYLDTHMKCSSSRTLFGSKTQRNSDLRKFVEILSIFLQFVDLPCRRKIADAKNKGEACEDSLLRIKLVDQNSCNTNGCRKFLFHHYKKSLIKMLGLFHIPLCLFLNNWFLRLTSI